DAGAREVRLCRSSWEVGEQGRAIGGGIDGAKGRGQGKCGPANHVPGTEPGKRVTCAGTHTTSGKAKEEGTVHRSPPPHQYRSLTASVLRLSELSEQGLRPRIQIRQDPGTVKSVFLWVWICVSCCGCSDKGCLCLKRRLG